MDQQGMFSHHSHSGQFCAHAKGTLEQVVLEAISKRWSTLGLSEHVPRYRQQDLYPEEEGLGLDHLATTFEAYVKEAWRLKQLYADKITLLVGIETEYINPEGLDRLVKLLQSHGNSIQYIVGSVHHCHEQPIDFDKPRFDNALNSLGGKDDEERFSKLFEAYFDAQYTLLQRLKPAVVGHFDLCRLYYPDRDFKSFPAVWDKVERNINFAVGYGGLFEINASAFRKGWTSAYPAPDVFEAIVAAGGRFTLSDDSHGPLAIGLHYDKACKYMEDQGLETLFYLKEVSGADGKSELVPTPVQGKPWLKSWPEHIEKLHVV
ncbi:histidinol phosphate phosphatase H [Meredithblackwellia eburnea MCA 4105]